MSYSPVTLPTPSVEVSLQGGGTIDQPVIINSGTFDNPDWPGYESAYRNYRYVATPNPGYRFKRFDIYVQEYTQALSAYIRDGVYPVSKGGTENNGAYVYETDVGADGYIDVVDEPGATWWWYAPLGRVYSDREIVSVRVVAVFEKRNSGRLVYSPNQGGQLVYSVNQNGALVYDG